MSQTKSKWITQKEASEIAGKSLSAIHQLVKNERLASKEIFGKRLVSRSDVLNFKPKKTGRPPKGKNQ